MLAGLGLLPSKGMNKGVFTLGGCSKVSGLRGPVDGGGERGLGGGVVVRGCGLGERGGGRVKKGG